MDYLIIITSILTLLAYLVIGYIVKSYLPSYVKTKGENKANKEDLAVLTQIVEDIKTNNQLLIEKNKSDLQELAIKQEKKRIVYEEIVEGLRVFLQGHDSGADAKVKFYQGYAKAWLWASDDVLKALDDFLGDAAIKTAKGAESGGGVEESQSLYSKLILEMRSDVGLPNNTNIQYRFFQFK